MMMDAEEPLGQEDIMARYAHTSWETIEDDTFFAEVRHLPLIVHCAALL